MVNLSLYLVIQGLMTTSTLQHLLDLTLFTSITYMLLVAPYTKVEESFNVQAIHDFINLGIDSLDSFDHMYFPGAVKRTCIGSLLLSLPSIYLSNFMRQWALRLISLATLINSIVPTSLGKVLAKELPNVLKETKVYQLIITRFLLSLVTFFSIIYLRKSIAYACSKTSKNIGIWFSFFMYPLPHILFYSSRLLPNFICLPLFNAAIGLFLCGDIPRSITILVFVGVVFRFEVLVFTGALIFFCVSGIFRYGRPIMKFREAVVSVATSLLLSGFLSARIDSYFWNVEITIPEFESFIFNILKGNSSEWGVEPFHAYFTRYLPKLFASQFELTPILTLLFTVFSLLNAKKLYLSSHKKPDYNVDYVNYGVGTLTTLLWSSYLYMLVLSVNGHKEWRFMVYLVPIFCCIAASAFEWVLSKVGKFIRKLLLLSICLLFLGSLLFSFVFGLISSWNYTGGDAAQKLNLRLIDMYGPNANMIKPIVVHWDVGTCMNGASLFTQIGDNKASQDQWVSMDDQPVKYWIIYDKTEDTDALAQIVDDFDYWVQYDDEPLAQPSDGYEWILVDMLEGYDGINTQLVISLLKNPGQVFAQLFHSIESKNFTWIQNVLDNCIKKKVRGKIWERAKIQSL
ncbi:uncharacterized protein C5L36_0E01690 [Pichia kudriavzevii]|uniref:Mannosyltransferase n=3 Tax=Pichia kudriavzevii TaxID=4909 RepID=A0A2U9RAQ6_PICKU|nr:uncharacterized protein C5L36_0E01690 [Pichia kudriavzevii]AWU78106.1 hypothetical protein C5L36_0E01690 [Pichia kudriavzevii]